MSFKNKSVKLFVSCFLVLMAAWVAVPKVYIHDLLKHDHSTYSVSMETQVQSENADDCEFGKYNKPAYFNIFKFISSFIPVKSPGPGRTEGPSFILSTVSHAISLLRAPPAGE